MIDQGIHIVTGSLGDGKTLRAVQIAEWFLKKGRRVATNVNLNVEYLCEPECNDVLVTRIPDKPTVEILKTLGYGSDKKGEYGLLLLDELGMWFNSREFGDKTRLPLIKHIIHLRKYRWIAVFIAQKQSMIDKQVRDIGSTVHSCRSTKTIALLKWLPRIHVCTMRTTFGAKAGSDIYRSTHLFPAYDTEQQFADSTEDLMSKDDPPELTRSKALNGHYQLLPPKRLSPGQVAEAKKSQDDLDYKTLKNALAVAAVAINVFLWWPDRDGTEAQSTDSSAPVGQIKDIPTTVVKSRSIDEHFQGFTIREYVKIGDYYRYSFDSPFGVIDQRTVESEGFTIRDRGAREALVVGPDYEFRSIY